MNLPIKIVYFLLFLFSFIPPSFSQDKGVEGADLGSDAVFDDRALINGYTDKYAHEPKEVLIAMLTDYGLGDYKVAAAIRVFKQKFADELFKAEKPLIIRKLYRRLNRTDSPFVQVEIFHTLIVLDRYQYFAAMAPLLIQKFDHYNIIVSALAYDNMMEITKTSTRPREARIVFNVLRKMFFLQRKRLAAVGVPDQKLKQKINLLRWSIKTLGTQELKNLPAEVIGLL